ncbi:MAG: hypothetical protein ACKOYM_06095, partial [Actinomycetes bacterium]
MSAPSNASGARSEQSLRSRPRLRVFHDDVANSTGIRFDTFRKAIAVRAWLGRHLHSEVEVVVPDEVSEGELAQTHAEEYLDAIRTGEPYNDASSNGLGWDESLWGSVVASTSAAVAAVLYALRCGGVAAATSSGLHHARWDQGAGFCTLNGLVVAARAALAAEAKRVLIIDLDAHCGGGTASLIVGLDGVEQVDVSVVPFDSYPSTDQARLWTPSADDYLQVVGEALDSVANPTEVDVVIYNAGMDPHERAGGVSGITAEVLRARDRMVMEWTERHGLPVGFVLAGGY